MLQKLLTTENSPERELVRQPLRRRIDWAPVPDLAYISYERVPANWDGEGPCPGILELVVEIIFPGQTFGELTQKATDYLQARVDRVWVVDTKAQSVTIFRRDELPQTVKANEAISAPLLPGLEIPVFRLFAKASQFASQTYGMLV